MPRAVLRVLVSHALAATAMAMPWPLLLVMVHDRFAGTPHAHLALGLAGAARLLPYVVLSWAGGVLADRVPRDRLVRVTLAARVALLALTAALVAQDRPLLAVATASATVACGTPAYPALAAAMPTLAGAHRRRATDALVTIEVAAFVVGPALGGVMLAVAVEAWVLPASVGLATLALVCFGRPVVEVPGRTIPGTSGEHALGALRRSPAATRAVLTVGVLNGVDAALALTLLPLATRLWADGVVGYGWAAAALGFGAVGAPLLWWLGRVGAVRARRGLLLLTVAVATVALVPAAAWAVLPLALFGAAQVQVESAATQVVQDEVDDRHRAGALGLTDGVMVAAALVGALTAPWLSALLGVRPLLALLALTLLATVSLPVTARPTTRLPTQRTAPPAVVERRREGRPAVHTGAKPVVPPGGRTYGGRTRERRWSGSACLSDS